MEENFFSLLREFVKSHTLEQDGDLQATLFSAVLDEEGNTHFEKEVRALRSSMANREP